jgi:hypothetical protein
MLDKQKMAVDQLVDVIQTIQIGRKTGTLTATRGENATYEIGTIVFVGGKVTQAKVGRRTDRDALNWLSTWGICQCTFVPLITPGDNQEQKVPLTSLRRSIHTTDTDPKPLSSDKQTGPIDARKTGPLTPPTLPDQAVPHLTKPFNVALRLIEQNGLSRAHRRLFLLIDGTRSIADLTRILKRDEQEIIALLHILQYITVITIGIPSSF